MNPPKNDFRQWIVYNNTLNDQRVYALYKVLETGSSRDGFACERYDGTSDLFRISQTGHVSSLVLTSEERNQMRDYLKTHYILGEDIEKWISTADERAKARNQKSEEELPYFLDPRYNPQAKPTRVPTKANVNQIDNPRKFLQPNQSNFFLNPVPRKHVLGYAGVAILLMQVLIIPGNVFHYKFPEFVKYAFSLIVFVIQHIAVRNYRNYFIVGGASYNTVWSITFWLYVTVFGLTALELTIIDTIRSGKFDVVSAIVIPLILVVAGLFSGWFFSLFVFLMNKGNGKATSPANSR